MRGSYISFVLHVIDRHYIMKEVDLGAVPFDVAHTSDNIFEKLKSLMSKTLGVDTFTPVLTTDGASNMKKAATSE